MKKRAMNVSTYNNTHFNSFKIMPSYSYYYNIYEELVSTNHWPLYCAIYIQYLSTTVRATNHAQTHAHRIIRPCLLSPWLGRENEGCLHVLVHGKMLNEKKKEITDNILETKWDFETNSLRLSKCKSAAVLNIFLLVFSLIWLMIMISGIIHGNVCGRLYVVFFKSLDFLLSSCPFSSF